ncbi:MAG TPA: delta-60 repeat domain-containing protein, partial [Solirubrobacterales bacterium]|nr:delta-60 repeat domain-containing protein [Solirubrobacterales bacterium]
MIRLGRSIRIALLTATATALGLLATAGPAAAATLLVQPDGKIVLAGRTHPAYGALARLNPDGSLDPSFGQGGFAIDQRTVNFSALALQPDGRIVGGAGPGSVISRYLPDGAPDPGFAGGGLGGTNEPGQSYSQGPSAALLVQPGGGFVAAGNRDLGAFDYEAWVRRYDAGGALLETAGRLPLQGEAISSTGLTDLLERPDGSLIGAGWTSGLESSQYRSRSLLVRFRPGSGSDFDPSFGGGAGLVRPDFSGRPASLNALAMDGDKLLVAGGIAGTLLLARFDEEGNLDRSFGEGGFVAPPIVGPEDAPEGAAGTGSIAGEVVVMLDGDVVLGGSTSQWSTWTYIKMLGWRCNACPQPLLARFDENGKLDPGFGSGGILRLLKPDGSVLLGSAGQVTALADGKILVHGYLGRKPFVARLNPDGSYDPGFGDGGLTIVDVPCSGISQEELRPEGCVPSAVVTLGLRGLRRGKPALSLRISPNLPWAAIGHIALTLPHGVRPTRKLRSRLRVTGVGGSPGKGSVKVLG